MGGFRGNKEKEEMLWLNYNLRNRNNNDNKEKRKLSTGCACVYSLTAMECDVTNCFKLLSSFPHNNDITQENKRQRNTFYTWFFFCQDIFILTTDVTKETFLTKKYLPVVENGPHENL